MGRMSKKRKMKDTVKLKKEALHLDWESEGTFEPLVGLATFVEYDVVIMTRYSQSVQKEIVARTTDKEGEKKGQGYYSAERGQYIRWTSEEFKTQVLGDFNVRCDVWGRVEPLQSNASPVGRRTDFSNEQNHNGQGKVKKIKEQKQEGQRETRKDDVMSTLWLRDLRIHN